MDLAERNWKICMKHLDDAIEALEETRKQLEVAMKNLQELRYRYEPLSL